MSERRLLVRQIEDGRWVLGREDAPVEAFESKEAAVRAGIKLVMRRPEVELIVDDEDPKTKKRPRRKKVQPMTR